MAAAGAEADVDADVFAAYADKVTVVDIKNALARRFKPEQVARFGNTHLIYTSLRHKDFIELIAREIEKVRERAARRFGVAVTVDESVHDLIYRNGVFPVQGVRPVFSSVADILESNLAKLLFEAVLAGEDRITLAYDVEARALTCRVGDRAVVLPYTGRLDRIRESSPMDKIANVAVHEAGHAVMYAVLFGLAPLRPTARVASSYVSGFTSPHPIYETAGSLIRQAKVALAGGIAEELVFGKGLASVGRSADRERATMTIIDFIRRHGFDHEFQANYMLGNEYSMDRTVPEPDIEKNGTGCLAAMDAILVPGGFGERGIEGKIQAVRHARENRIPYLGICLGMQLAIIEFGRDVLGYPDAHSTEFNRATTHPVIALITEWQDRAQGTQQRTEASNLGGTMRLGAQEVELGAGTRAREIYGRDVIAERHRHRFEFNNRYLDAFRQAGLVFSGFSRDNLVEIIELPSHPWFVATQFHPEFTSTPRGGHPLFTGFIRAARAYRAALQPGRATA